MTSSDNKKMFINDKLNDFFNEITSEVEQEKDAKNQYKKVVRAGIAKWVSEFKKGNIDINTVDDLQKLIEIDILLLKKKK